MKDHDLEQSKSIIDRVLVGGALGHFGMEVSVDVIKKLIDKVFTWRNEAKYEVKQCREESPSEVADYVLPELAYELSYIEASCSHASVAIPT